MIRDEHRPPQEGYQQDFLSSNADIVIGGGSAGCGKTWTLLSEAVRNYRVPEYGGIIFRRTYPEIMRQGGMWDEAKKMFPSYGGVQNESKVTWFFPSGAKVGFSHLQYEKDLDAFQGAQIPMIGFDELTHFSKSMFFYLLTRNRSTTGIRPYVRATCNPDPDSWVAEFISWWINQETGFPIPERAGVKRYFIIDNEAYIWGNTKQEVYDQAHHILDQPMFEGMNKADLIKSITFIPGNIYDNKILLTQDPGYLANLLSQDEQTKSRLLMGNWLIRADKLNLFDIFKLRDMFTNILPTVQRDQSFIIIDHARFGRDNCIIGTWHGWHCVRIDILPKSDTNDIMRIIKEIRRTYRGIPMSHVLIDQDGIGVKDSTDCRIFVGGGTPNKFGKEPQLYKNRKTQCYYMAAEKVNNNEVLISLDNVWFHTKGDRKLIKELYLKGKSKTIKEIIIEDLRVIKRERVDLDQRKQMTNKENIKAAINRSPDFGDMIGMRAEFEYVKQPKGFIIR